MIRHKTHNAVAHGREHSDRPAGYMTTLDEGACLKTNPFEGDFGSPGDKVLKDKLGVKTERTN